MHHLNRKKGSKEQETSIHQVARTNIYMEKEKSNGEMMETDGEKKIKENRVYSSTPNTELHV